MINKSSLSVDLICSRLPIVPIRKKKQINSNSNQSACPASSLPMQMNLWDGSSKAFRSNTLDEERWLFFLARVVRQRMLSTVYLMENDTIFLVFKFSFWLCPFHNFGVVFSINDADDHSTHHGGWMHKPKIKTVWKLKK